MGVLLFTSAQQQQYDDTIDWLDKENEDLGLADYYEGIEGRELVKARVNRKRSSERQKLIHTKKSVVLKQVA